MRKRIVQLMCVCAALVLLRMAQSYAQIDPKIAARVKTELTSKPWNIFVISQEMAGGEIKSLVEEDILSFTDATVSSKRLSEQGYSKDGSIYKIRVGQNEAYIWESIQLHENQTDTVLMKGELKDGRMKGVIVYQRAQGSLSVTFTTEKP